MSYSYTTINSTVDMNTNSLEYFEYFIVDATSGNIEIKLPTAYDGSYFQFHRLDTTPNLVTFVPQTGNTVNGGSSFLLPVNRYTQVIKIQNDWRIPRIAFN
jgi:hypothetical protein